MAPTSPPGTRVALDRLATHCIAARAIIEEVGTPVMRRLVDLLLYEIGVALAEQTDGDDPAPATTG